MGITIVGLGPGDAGLLTRAVWQTLEQADVVYLRTKQHPCVPDLPSGPEYRSFDELYDAVEAFTEVYETIVAQLLEKAQMGEAIVYAVPGDPSVAESTVSGLRRGCETSQIACKVLHGVSFIEPTLAAINVDALDGLQILDALDIARVHHPPINPDFPALIAQIYSREVASNVKLTLMNQYPDDHPVILVDAVGSIEQRVEHIPLYEIDRRTLSHLTSLFIPRFDQNTAIVTSFEGLQNTMAQLRAPDGCPWDREQDHRTLTRYLLEEAYEFIDAVEADDIDQMREELGDLLLQVVFHGQVAVDDGEFLMTEVIRTIDTKLKRRHPHVWGDIDVNGDAQEVLRNWEQIKSEERAEKGQDRKSILDGISSSMPALLQAFEYDRRAMKVGFDWDDEQGVVEKIREEINEVLAANSVEHQFSEIGDLLLAVAVWARWMNINPEDALRAANRKFYDRFTHVERLAQERGQNLLEMTLDEKEALWDEAKKTITARK